MKYLVPAVLILSAIFASTPARADGPDICNPLDHRDEANIYWYLMCNGKFNPQICGEDQPRAACPMFDTEPDDFWPTEDSPYNHPWATRTSAIKAYADMVPRICGNRRVSRRERIGKSPRHPSSYP